MSEEFEAKTPMAKRFRGFLPVVVDVETGGFNPRTDALLEIAMVTLRFDNDGFLHPHQTFSANIHPFDGANLEREALDFTGIDRSMCCRALNPKKKLSKLYSTC